MKKLLVLSLLFVTLAPSLEAAELSVAEQAAVEQACLQNLRPRLPLSHNKGTSPFAPGFEDCDSIIGTNATEHAQKKTKADLDTLKAATEKVKQ